MSASDLRALFVTLLVGMVGGEPVRWKRALGDIALHPLSTHPRCNWSIAPKGDEAELSAIEKAAAVIREEHPYVERG